MNCDFPQSTLALGWLVAAGEGCQRLATLLGAEVRVSGSKKLLCPLGDAVYVQDVTLRSEYRL